MNIEICPFCGIRTSKSDGPTHRYLLSTPGCWKIYGEILAKEYQDFLFFKYHNLTVDAYALQHPGEKSKQTINSANIHLISLYAYFELGREASSLSRIKQSIAKDKLNFKWLKPPSEMTEINISHIQTINEPNDYNAKVEEWAYYLFIKWRDYHDIAKSYMEKIE